MADSRRVLPPPRKRRRPSVTEDLAGRLAAGAELLGVPLSEAQSRALLAYGDLILKWNKVYNLTAVRTPEAVLTHHLLDSLAAVPPLLRHLKTTVCLEGKGAALLDVGAGAGLPGVVFAIAIPALQVTCVDAVAKKMAFVQQVAVELKLSNLKPVHSRVEQLS
ncbi:MAG: 16S rRNA (guanine(527)-N(7))-methyltransferase RsmG, partial [Comamonadaceae bacterium]